MPSAPSGFNRQEIERIVGGNASLIRKFEQMTQQTLEVLPDQVNLLTSLISAVATSAEDAAGYADAARKAADDALSVFATLEQPSDQTDSIAALQAQISAVADPLPDRFTFYAAATETIAAGAMVNVFESVGRAFVRNADADPSQYEAIGWVESTFTVGQIAVVYVAGINTLLSGLTPGVRYYLSDTVPGGVTPTAPVTVGNLYQPLGIAVSATSLAFTYQAAVVL